MFVSCKFSEMWYSEQLLFHFPGQTVCSSALERSHAARQCGVWSWIHEYHKAPLLVSCVSISKLNSTRACPLSHTSAVQAAFSLDQCSFTQSGLLELLFGLS